MTGAPLPAGATAVVPVEATDGDFSRPGDTVSIHASVVPGQHVRRAGEDVTAGTTVLHAGQLLTPAALGLAAALGIAKPESRSAATRSGDVDGLGAGCARHAAAARPDLRVQRRDAGRRGPRRGRRGRDVVDDRRTTSTPSARSCRPCPRRRPHHHHRRRQRGRVRGGQGLARRGGRVRQGRHAAGHAAGRGNRLRARRSSRCPATRSARWCRSRCSSARRCVPRWGCRIPTGPALTVTLLEDLTSPRGQAAVPPRRAGCRPVDGHQLRPTRLASPALAGVGELPAGDRRGRRRAGGRFTRAGMGSRLAP